MTIRNIAALIIKLIFEGDDYFCGAGGVSEGILRVKGCFIKHANNHDQVAIDSHAANHIHTEHATEDIRLLNPRNWSIKSTKHTRRTFGHFSLECTNYSGAKGGLSKDADSRTLKDDSLIHIKYHDYDYVTIENVREFLDDGPLRVRIRTTIEGYKYCPLDKIKEKRKVVGYKYQLEPVPHRKGSYYKKWLAKMYALGYRHEHRIINAADFGAHTSRKRLIIIFTKQHLPIVWPTPTHSKDGNNGLKKWRPCREKINLENHGKSIFSKTWAVNSEKRFLRGLIKHVAGSSPKEFEQFLALNYTSGGDLASINEPCKAIPTKDRFTLMTAQFFVHQYSTGQTDSSLKSPLPAILNNPKAVLMTANPFIIDTQYNNASKSVDETFPVITADRHWHYLVNPQWGINAGGSVDAPCPTIIARQDKSPMYLLTAESGQFKIPVYDTDTETMVKIKQFMALYGLGDIKYRMLSVQELKEITGFPANYILLGSQTQQKKFIGNAVPPVMMKAVYQSLYDANLNLLKIASDAKNEQLRIAI